MDILHELYETVEGRRQEKQEGSYTCYLFEKGLDKILKKCGEECSEVIIAAKNGKQEDTVGELADLLYHLTVLMVNEGIPFEAVEQELAPPPPEAGQLKAVPPGGQEHVRGAPMDREQLLSQWREEAARGMSGWDFSHIQGRCTVEPLPWDYPQVVREFLRPGVRLLDMGTGGGELLLTLGHPYELTSVTEGWEPNLALWPKKACALGHHREVLRQREGGCPCPSRMTASTWSSTATKATTFRRSAGC